MAILNIKLTNKTLSIKDAMPESADFGKMNNDDYITVNLKYDYFSKN